MRLALCVLILLAGCSSLPVETGPPVEVHFCPREDCASLLISFINGSADCALYDLSIPKVKSSLQDSRVITDRRNSDGFPSARAPVRPALMHNKFCVKRDAIWTGSWNPTGGSLHNNVVIISSPAVARNFLDEFEELWFGRRDGRVRFPRVRYNAAVVETFFCPDDGCERRVAEVLAGANSSVRFALYSFTSDAIGDVLLSRHASGVVVSGVVGTRNAWDEFDRLRAAGIDVSLNRSIHDKVFIVDGSVVITGSYNPTGNGDRRNDENLLILDDAAVAARFCAEFGC